MELSGIVVNGELVSQEDWEKHIDNLKSRTKKSSKEELKKVLIESIKKRAPKQKFGILFSGGLDSLFIAFVCKQLKADFICYTVGMEKSKDLESAQKTAEELGFELKAKTITNEELEKLAEKVTRIVGPDSMKVSIGIVIYAAAELAKKDKINAVFTGLGAEELFAGYHKYLKAKDVNEEGWLGLKTTYCRDFLRDYPIAKELGLKALTPFLDADVILNAMAVPGSEKIKQGHKKFILREIAQELGLKKEFAFREKQAAQFGAKTHKALEKLAKQNKKNRISDYLKKFYPLGALVSSGKDSIYAMYKMIVQGYDVKCIMSMKSRNPDSYMFHTPAVDLVDLQAECIGIPIIKGETKGEKEKELGDLKNLIRKAKEKYNIAGIVSGALFSSYQKERIEKICKELGLKSFAPLWHIDQEKEIREIIGRGFKFIMTKVACEGLDKSWLGKEITQMDADKLVELNKKIGINIAGEGGEYETLVLDGPLFRKKITIVDYEIKEDGSSALLVVKKVQEE